METEFKHIILDEDGRLWIIGTNLRVIEVVMACQAYVRVESEDYHLQHPAIHLAQIHAALAYYYEHQVEMDQAIRDDLSWAESERERNLGEIELCPLSDGHNSTTPEILCYSIRQCWCCGIGAVLRLDASTRASSRGGHMLE